jgi:hypothetical protein
MKWHHVIHLLLVLSMVFGALGVTIQIVLLHVEMEYKREHEFVIINQMVDNHVMVQRHNQFHVIQISVVQVGMFSFI